MPTSRTTPRTCRKLLAALANADVAVGSRYAGGVRVLNWEVRRLLLSLGANAYVRFLSGLACVDCTSGFRGYRASVFRQSADGIGPPAMRSCRSCSSASATSASPKSHLLHGAAARRVEDVAAGDRRSDRASVGPVLPAASAAASAAAGPPARRVMKLSIYTFVKDGLFYDFHVEAMLRHHAAARRRDHRQRRLQHRRHLRGDRGSTRRSRSIDSHWDRSDPSAWHRDFKNQARELCTGDWCILLDCDEFIPEWEFPRLRHFSATTSAVIVPVNSSTSTRTTASSWRRLPKIVPDLGMRIHRNVPEIEVWGDGANVRRKGATTTRGRSTTAGHSRCITSAASASRAASAEMAHAGQTAQRAEPAVGQAPGFVFNMFPHRGTTPTA